MDQHQFSSSIGERYFDDYVKVKGAVFEYGPISVSEAEIIDFAKRFDPQTMHIDPQAAARGQFGGLIASGWHTISLMMRLFIDNYLTAVASLASPGVDEVRWYKPVRPNDSLRLRITVLDANPSRSKPDRGMVHSLLEGINQNGDVVASLRAMNLIGLKG